MLTNHKQSQIVVGETLEHSPPSLNERSENPNVTSLTDYGTQQEVILRWDPHGKFIRLNEGNQLVQHLMVNYKKAKRAQRTRKRGVEGLLEPHQTLTITGTEDDTDTVDRPRWDVIDLFEEVSFEFRYIPDWGWVYPNMPDSNQKDIIDRYVDRVEWLYERVDEMGLDHVELIPLAKGLNKEHYHRAVDVYNQLGVSRIGMYGVQTPSIKKFVSRTEQAIDLFDPDGVLVIGKQSPRDVARLPDRVDGVAGFWNWKQASELSADGYSSEGLAKWYYSVKEKLRTGHTHRQIGLDTHFQTEVRTDGRGR